MSNWLKAIDDSALIITAEGRVYHLDLLPEEIADTILLVGIEIARSRFGTLVWTRTRGLDKRTRHNLGYRKGLFGRGLWNAAWLIFATKISRNLLPQIGF